MDYTSEFENYWSGINPTFEKNEESKSLQFEQFQTMGAPKSEVGIISPKAAIDQTNDQKTYLDSIENAGQQLDANGQPIKTASVPSKSSTLQQQEEEARKTGRPFKTMDTGEIRFQDSQGGTFEESKATYVNENGQEITLSQTQLNDQQTKDFLEQGGYELSTSEGAIPNQTVDVEKQRMQDESQAASKKVEDLANDFLSYNVDTDPAYAQQAKNINAEFERLRRNMERVNYSRERAFETRSFRTGTAQYAGDIAAGILGEEINQGSQRIAEISQQESKALSDARNAYQTGKYAEFNNKIEALKDIREQKAKTLDDYNKAIIDANKALQDQEKSILEKDKFDFEVYKFSEEQKGIEKPITVAPGSSIYDPNTGKFIGTAPKPVDIKAPEIEKWGGQVHQWNPTTNRWDILGLESDLVGASADNISAANLIASGKAKLTDYAQESRGAISTLLEKMPPKQEDVTKIQEKIKNLDNISKGIGFELNKAVGVNWLSRIKFNPLSFDDKAQKNRLIANIEQMIGEKALNALIDAKANGATFGALSEGELQLLKDSSTKFSSWARDTDGDGKTDYYEIDENTFIEEVDKIKGEYEKLISDTNGTQVNSVTQKIDDYYVKNPSKREVIDKMESTNNPTTGKPYTEEEKAQILGISFNGVDGDTNQAIKEISFGGNKIKVSSELSDKLVMADRDFYRATGKHLKINQSYRTTEQQTALYKELKAKGARVALPGKSFHEKGLAIDVTNWKEAEEYLRKYGLKNDLADDKGHFSYGEFT